MARKKVRNKKISLKQEIQDVEAWIHQRRKFFWKLLWVIILIVGLIIISNIFLRVQGVGI